MRLNVIRLTSSLIEAGKTGAGGYKKRQLLLLGVTPRSSKGFDFCAGWKKDLVGQMVTEEVYQEFLRLKNEAVIDKFEQLLRSEKSKTYETELSPMSVDQLNVIVDKAEEDAQYGLLTSAADLKNEIDSEFKIDFPLRYLKDN
jgi:hypothetical protein